VISRNFGSNVTDFIKAGPYRESSKSGREYNMKVFYLPGEIKALVFDMDLTLYTSPEYGKHQIDALVEKLGEVRGLPFEEMKREVEETRMALSGNGKKTSFSTTLNSFGISTEEIVVWRNEIFEPQRFIKEDPRLKETLRKLSGSYSLGLVTNNPVFVANKTLAVLGVEEFFPVIVGLDTCMTAKPHEKPYLKFMELTSIPSETCVSIGDRYDVDLDIPMKMGMGGILVDGVEDVYELPGVLVKGGNYGD
jgi:phosphoglycolate phosphatase/putative hydrolase of the HAD superfamily